MTYEERFAAGTEALRANDAQTAIQHLRACVEENSSDPRALLYLGIAYGLAEDYTAAEGCLLQAVRIDPGSTQARFNLARLRHRQGRLQEALEDYLATLRIDPTHEKAQSEADRLAAELGAGAAPEPAPLDQQAYGAAEVVGFERPTVRSEDVVLRSVDVLSAMKVSCIIGFGIGVLYAIGYGIAGAMTGQRHLLLVGIFQLVGGPIGGLVGGVISAALYNALAAWVGPIALELRWEGSVAAVRRVDALSCAKIAAAQTLVVTLLVLLIYIPFVLLMMGSLAVAGGGPRPGAMIGGAVVGLAIGCLFAVGLTFVFTLLIAALYNWATSFTGGVAFEAEDHRDTTALRRVVFWRTVISAFVPSLPFVLLYAAVLLAFGSTAPGAELLRPLAVFIPVIVLFVQMVYAGCYNLSGNLVGGLVVRFEQD